MSPAGAGRVARAVSLVWGRLATPLGHHRRVSWASGRCHISLSLLAMTACFAAGDVANRTLAAGSPPAPLVCKSAPTRFMAVGWTPTCECTSGNSTIVRSDLLPCNSCYSGRTLTNYQCRDYSNIVTLATLDGNWGGTGECGPAGWEKACRSNNWGTFANVSVACAIDPTDPVCLKARPLPRTNPVGTAAQPYGEKYLRLSWVQGGQPIMTHPADVAPLKLTKCPATGPDVDAFTGIWWDHGVAAIGAQAEMWFPKYKQAGGQLDELVADWEAQMWSPGRCPVPANNTAAGVEATLACLACTADKWRAIEHDPRFVESLTELQALGFVLNGSLANTMTRYQCVPTSDPTLRPQGMAACNELNGLDLEQKNLNVWRAFVEKRQTDAWVRAIMPAATRAFPDVRFSMYSHYTWDSNHCLMPDVNSGTMNCKVGHGSTSPNVSAPVYYDEWLTFDCLHPHGQDGGVDAPDRCQSEVGLSNTLKNLTAQQTDFSFNFTNFNIAVATINNFRQIAQAQAAAATAGRRASTVLAPWVGFKSFFFDYRCPGYSVPWHDYPSSPGCPEPDGYWQERVLHFGLTGAARYYYFNVFYECVYGKRSTHEDDDAMSASLAELDVVIGCPAGERRWIPDSAHGWRSDFILSGMDVGSARRTWRFTPSLPLQIAEKSVGIPNNRTKWDPHILSSYINDTLSLSPLKIDFNGQLLEDCVISFEQGVVLDVFAGPSVRQMSANEKASLPPGASTTSAAPFGLWIVQPQTAAPPPVSCQANDWHGKKPFYSTWPLSHGQDGFETGARATRISSQR